MKVLIIPTICASLLVAASSSAAALPTGQDPAVTAPAKTAAPTTEPDPICGMNVDTASAAKAGRTSVYEGKTYYFCNDSCKKQFDAEPAKFAAQATAAADSATGGCCPCCGGTAARASGSTGRMCGRRMR